MKNKTKQKNRVRTLLSTMVVSGSCWLGAVSSQAAITGQWDFNNAANPLQPTVGAPLEYFDGVGGPTESGTQVGTTTALGLPNIGDQAANVMIFPKCDPSMGYYVLPGIPANGPSNKAENYTILMDILWPAASTGKWRSLIQISDAASTTANSTDGELFVNDGNGIGISGSYSGTLLSNTWHRVAFVKNGTSLSKYIDGQLVGTQTLEAAGANWNIEPAGPNGLAILFGDDNGETESGVLNSLQFHDVPLSRGQIVALGGPQAAGLPQVLPDVPSFVDSWIPATPFAAADTDVGAVINAGSSTITDIALTVDGNPVSLTITQEAELITAQADGPGFAPSSDHVLVLSYNDSKDGLKSATNSFRVPLFYEDFDQLPLQNSADPALGGEPETGTNVWTQTPPAGWAIDNSQMPPQSTPPSGRPEWEGWAFANWEWVYNHVDNQDRGNFTKARGTVASADPDEWDDYNNPDGTRGYFNTFLETKPIELTSLPANSAFFRFDSSWRPEGFDDAGPDGLKTNNQTAVITVSINNGAPVEIMRWDSDSTNAFFHPDNVNETVTLPLNNPAGTSTVVLRLGLINAANDWWWAVDNLLIDAGPIPPTIDGQPASATRAPGGSVSFSVAASGPNLTYQWQKDQADIDGATSSTLLIDPVTANDAGAYRCVVTNPGGTATSEEAILTVAAIPPTIDGQPASATRAPGGWVSFSVAASGPNLTYQWQKDQADIDGATSSTLLIDPVTANDAGAYRCLVTNPDGTATSEEAILNVVEPPQDLTSLANDLAVYLPLDNDYADASGNNHNGTPVGAPSFAGGQVGSGAVRCINVRSSSSYNYVTLGDSSSLPFGQTTDFTVAFWIQTERVTGDPSVVAVKDWGSGGNTGWIIGTQSDGRIEWNYKRSTETRKDLDYTAQGNILNNGRWAHVVVVWNINGDAETYYDGFKVDGRSIAPPNGDIYAAGTKLNLGQDGTGAYGDGEWDGLLDDVAFWNRALTADEVLALYGTGLRGFSFLNPPTPQPTLGYSLAGGQLTLTWQGEGFALQVNGDVGAPAGWSNVPGAGANSATVPTATGTKFYRLKK